MTVSAPTREPKPRATALDRATWVVLALIPALYATMLIGANSDPFHRLDSVPAAIVTHDTGAPAPDAKTSTNLGAELAKGLVGTTAETAFDWTVTDPAAAEDGLLDGRYLAVLTIPADFTATALAATNGAGSTPATLRLETNDAVNQILGNIAATMGAGLADKLNAQVTAAYLAQLYQGSNALKAAAAQSPDGAADALPTYPPEAIPARAALAFRPVVIDTVPRHEVPSYGYGLAPYFIGLALWVGGVACYVTTHPLRPSALAGPLAARRVALKAFLPGAAAAAIGAVAVVLIAYFPLGIKAAHLGGLFAMTALSGLAFMAFNYGLVTLFGSVGRFFSLVLLVFQVSSAGGTYPVQTTPAFFQAVHPWLPLSHTVDTTRSLITGGPLEALPSACAMLVSCFALGAAMAVLGVRRHRRRLAAGEPRGFGGRLAAGRAMV